jgi:hypothetical protein
MGKYGRTLVLIGSLLVLTGAAACSSPTPPPVPAAPSPQQPAQPVPQQPAAGWVEITFPPAERLVPNPVIIEGSAAPTAQVVRIQIREPRQNILLGEQVVTFGGTSELPRSFSVQVSYTSPPSPMYGVIQAFVNESAEPATELRVGLSAAGSENQ